MIEDKRLYLIDAYAMIFRGYYAFIKNPRLTSKGLDTSAIFGFTNSLIELIKREKPSHLAVVFDVGKASYHSDEKRFTTIVDTGKHQFEFHFPSLKKTEEKSKKIENKTKEGSEEKKEEQVKKETAMSSQLAPDRNSTE